jgi:hypothetical protein
MKQDNPQKIKKLKRKSNQRYYIKYKNALKDDARNYYKTHRKKCLKRVKKYTMKNHMPILEYVRKWRHKLKVEVFTHYSPKIKCVRCGYADLRALSIDHINNDGYKHRKTVAAPYLYAWLKRNNYPSGFQVLCMNCQWVKRLKIIKNNCHKRKR